MGGVGPDSASDVRMERFEGRTRQAEALAGRVADLLRQAISQRAKAALVVSGGSTPAPFFDALSRQELDWGRVTVTLADERWVPPDHEASNEGLVRRHLLRNRAESAELLGLYTGHGSAADAQQVCSERLERNVALPFDAVVLGMGKDGHCASLFPRAEGLKEAVDPDSKRLCAAVRPASAPHQRMTLTLNALLSSRNIFLLITGAEKLDVLERALAPGPPEEMPIRYVLRRSRPPVAVFFAP